MKTLTLLTLFALLALLAACGTNEPQLKEPEKKEIKFPDCQSNLAIELYTVNVTVNNQESSAFDYIYQGNYTASDSSALLCAAFQECRNVIQKFDYIKEFTIYIHNDTPTATRLKTAILYVTVNQEQGTYKTTINEIAHLYK